MNLNKKDLLLYAITDRHWLQDETLYSQVEKALQGGVSILQLREKDLNEKEFLESAKEIKELCDRYNVPLIINDNVDIALAVDAAGVHVGQKDMEAGEARAKLGPDKIIGVSARTVEQAQLAQSQGANYLGVGAVFPTGTKDDAVEVGRETVQQICGSVDIPIVAIGGITKENVVQLEGTGIDGVAVVSAVFAQENITDATKELKEIIRETLSK